MVHRSTQHRTTMAGVEARTLVSNRAFPRHAHDQFGVGVMFHGGQRSWSGVGQVETEAGDVMTCNPGEMHDGLPHDGAARGWRMLHLDPERVAEELAGELVRLEIRRPSIRSPALSALVNRLFSRITSGACALSIDEDLVRVLVAAMTWPSTPPGDGRLSPPVRRAMERLDDAPDQAVRLADLARLAGVSRFHLLRGFAREVGITPYAYLVQRRTSAARRMLAAGRPAAEAAVAAGFADQSHMTRAFGRQFGVTPAQYQRALG